ncbi:MAG: two-component regulator propeller domain-containing protein [Melioribacteraceae bacterium]
MTNRSFYLTLIYFICSFILYSQTPPYYHYTPADGLASATVYDIIQDRDGFIWLATLNGLNRFDGTRFITYGMADGLNSNSITSISEGDGGELYIGNFEKGLNILSDGKFKNYQSIVKGRAFKTTYLLDSKEYVYAYSPYAGIVEINKKNNVNADNIISPNLLTDKPILNRMIKTADNNLLVLTSRGLYSIKNSSLIKLDVSGLKNVNLNCAALDKDGAILLGGAGVIHRIKNNKVVSSIRIKLFDKNIVNLFVDSQRNIWFSIYGKGFYIIPFGSDKIINMGIKMNLENTQIDKLFEDNEGNIWIATFGKGVFCLTNLFIRNYFEDDGLVNNNVNCIQKDNTGKLLLGTINGISILDNGKIEQLKYSSGKVVSGYINNIIKQREHIYISLTSESAASREVVYKDQNFLFTRSQSACETNDGQFLFGSVGNNITIQKKFHYTHYPVWNYVFGDTATQNRINHIFEDSDKNIWIGSNLGLCMYTIPKGKSAIAEWKKKFFTDDTVLNSRINSIYEDEEKNIWFAAANGIACYNKAAKSITSYTNILGHKLLTVTSIVLDNQKRIWIGNAKGVYMYDGKSVLHLDSKTGLPSNEISSLYYDGKFNKLYVGSSFGFSEIDIYRFDNRKESSPKIRINKVIAGDSIYKSYSSLVFERDQNNVGIDISAINFSSPSTIKYKYKLNENWIETESNLLNFSSLENGTYAIQIKARTQNSSWSHPFHLTFRILPRFTETIWFYLIIVILLICLHLVFIYWRIKVHKQKISKELELSERINELKHQALSAMMNPHFIFNSLNSVQYLINSQRNEEANDYIATMAKLIRKNLDTAGSGFILLSEEINRLKLYLDLEKLRFQDSFSYDIIIGEDVDTATLMIPNMIIQPFVENTLWHGIINSGDNGKVSISFSFDDVEVESIITKSLIIKITDNGIGIKEAKKNKKDDHISKGIQIIEERLKLLSAKMQLPKPIMFEDLSNQNPHSHGTEVIISLPPLLYRIILPE